MRRYAVLLAALLPGRRRAGGGPGGAPGLGGGEVVRLAWRNLWRHRGRTAISAAAISLGFAALLVAFGVSEATHARVLEAAVRTAGGSVLVHADGWQRSRAGDLLVAEPGRVAEAAGRLPGVRAVIPRMILQGLLSSARGAEPVVVFGADAQAEAALVDRAGLVAQGAFLAPGEARPIVIGPKLARRLAVGLGDRVVVTAADSGGELARAPFRVSGILRPSAGLEEGIAFTTIEAAAAAVGAGERRTELGLVLDDDARRGEIAAALRAAAGDDRRLEFVTWDEALPNLLGFVRADRSVFLVFGLVVFAVMGFGTANVLLMSVLERVRELGLLSALGMTPGRTAQLVLAEAALLTGTSLALGYGLGLVAHLYLSRVGLEIGFSGITIEVSGVVVEGVRMRSAVEPLRWCLGGAGVAAIVLLSACYPALRAARVEPAQAMRTYE